MHYVVSFTVKQLFGDGIDIPWISGFKWDLEM